MAAKPNRQRSRESYHRRRAHRLVVPVEIDEVSTVKTLMDLGLLKKSDEDNRDAIGRAISKLCVFVVQTEDPIV